MAVKNRKLKVSKVKHNNQTTTKLRKQGKIKNRRHKKPQTTNLKQNGHIQNEVHDSAEESGDGQDMLEMVDKEDLEYLQRMSNKNNLLLPNEDIGRKKSKNRKRKHPEEIDDALERQYEDEHEGDANKKTKKPLLPIKTKFGIVSRSIEEEQTDEQEDLDSYIEEDEPSELTEDTIPEGLFTSLTTGKNVSTADLMVARHDELLKKKFKIGILCSGLLENPELKHSNFFALFSLMDERTKAGEVNLITIRKLAMLSILETFKDLLPDYQIKHQDFDGVKLKKDTLALQKQEKELLDHYKRYLQRLEKLISVLVKKKGDTRNIPEYATKLGLIALSCLCDLLVARPYFNYSSNVCHLIVPFMNNKHLEARTTVKNCCINVFTDDRKGEVSLMLVRKINNLVKSKSNDVCCEVLECLLALKIVNVNLDAEKDMEIKQKKMTSHKQRLINMSKKERKRNKKLQEVEQEMLETKAEENKSVKQKHLTETIKVVFMIYFRILKRNPNSKLLSTILEGLSKFGHIINLEYYSDLVNVLNGLLNKENLHYRQQLYCIDTVFSILSGQGDVLTLDPSRFYAHLYRNMLLIHAGKTHDDTLIVMKSIISILIKRRRKISQQLTLAFVKRMATLSLQLLHNGTLSCLGLVRNVMQQSRTVETLLELDADVGSGRYNGELMEPEYCNANSTAMYELTKLRQHYHPTVREMAAHVSFAVPSDGEFALPVELGKRSPFDLFELYNGSKVSFNPAIPLPKKIQPRKPSQHHIFLQQSFEDYCTSFM